MKRSSCAGSAVALVLGALAMPIGLSALDLTIHPDDLTIIARPDGGYDLSIRAKADIASVLLTESTQDPAGKAFHIRMPSVLVYGYPWSRSGSVAIGKGAFLNIRAFQKPYADYTGAFADNPYVISVMAIPVKAVPPPAPESPPPPAPASVEETVTPPRGDFSPETVKTFARSPRLRRGWLPGCPRTIRRRRQSLVSSMRPGWRETRKGTVGPNRRSLPAAMRRAPARSSSSRLNGYEAGGGEMSQIDGRLIETAKGRELAHDVVWILGSPSGTRAIFVNGRRVK